MSMAKMGAVRFDTNAIVERAVRDWGVRLDAGETLAFSRELEAVLAKTYDIKFPEVKWRQLLPMMSGGPGPGHDAYTYTQINEFGEAEIVHDFADNFPSVELEGKQFTSQINSIGNSFSYSLQDLRQSALTGRPLDSLKAAAARRVMERKVDALAATGNTLLGTKGLTNATGIQAVTITTKTTANDWIGANAGAGAKGSEILADCVKLIQAVQETTKGVHEADTLVLDTKGYSLVTTTRYNDYDSSVVADVLLKQIPSLKSIERWSRLDTAGASSKARIMAYARNPEVLEVVVPQDFEMFAPQARNMAFVVPCHMRFGGVNIRYPKAIAYMDGTQP